MEIGSVGEEVCDFAIGEKPMADWISFTNTIVVCGAIANVQVQVIAGGVRVNPATSLKTMGQA